jgi:hypothetical protein
MLWTVFVRLSRHGGNFKLRLPGLDFIPNKFNRAMGVALMRPLSIPVGKRPPTEATLLRRAGLYSLLNFIGQAGEMPIQPVVQVAFGLVCCEVADQSSLSRILAKFFD